MLVDLDGALLTVLALVFLLLTLGRLGAELLTALVLLFRLEELLLIAVLRVADELLFLLIDVLFWFTVLVALLFLLTAVGL